MQCIKAVQCSPELFTNALRFKISDASGSLPSFLIFSTALSIDLTHSMAKLFSGGDNLFFDKVGLFIRSFVGLCLEPWLGFDS